MKVLILNNFLQNAAAIKESVLNYNPGIESVTICYSPDEAVQQTEQFGMHTIILDLEAEGASQFILSVNKHPHRIISTSANYSRDYFTARLLESNSINSVTNSPGKHKKSGNAFSKLMHSFISMFQAFTV